MEWSVHKLNTRNQKKKSKFLDHSTCSMCMLSQWKCTNHNESVWIKLINLFVYTLENQSHASVKVDAIHKLNVEEKVFTSKCSKYIPNECSKIWCQSVCMLCLEIVKCIRWMHRSDTNGKKKTKWKLFFFLSVFFLSFFLGHLTNADQISKCLSNRFWDNFGNCFDSCTHFGIWSQLRFRFAHIYFVFNIFGSEIAEMVSGCFHSPALTLPGELCPLYGICLSNEMHCQWQANPWNLPVPGQLSGKSCNTDGKPSCKLMKSIECGKHRANQRSIC